MDIQKHRREKLTKLLNGPLFKGDRVRFCEDASISKRGDSGVLEWVCPRPGCLGVMEFSGNVALVSPPAYIHHCDVCNQSLSLKGAVFGNPYQHKP